MSILVLLIINTQRLQCRGAAGTIWADSRPCAECAKGRITAFTLLCLRYPYLPINPDNISMGDGESHPATTAVPPPVPIAAHNDTCFCNPARASSHSSSSPPPLSSPRVSLRRSSHFSVSVLPSYSGKDTLHQRAAECHDLSSVFIGREPRVRAFPACRLAPRHTLTTLHVRLIPCVAVTIDQF